MASPSAASDADPLTAHSLAPSLEARGPPVRRAPNRPPRPTSIPPGRLPVPPRAWGRRRGV